MAAEPGEVDIWVERGVALVCALLVLAISYTLVKLVFLTLDPGTLAEPPKLASIQITAIEKRDKSSEVDPELIAGWHLFGDKVKPPVEEEVDLEDIGKTRLQLELLGVFISSVEEKSSAIISEQRRDSKIYHIGESVSGNSTLSAVFADKVLLKRRGKLEALYFPESEPVLERVDHKSAAPKEPPPEVRKAKPEAEPERAGDAEPESVDVDPAKALKQLGLATSEEGGYKVVSAGNPFLSALGAKTGDTIVSINGQAVGDPEDDQEFFEEVMSQGDIKVEIERDGRRFTTTLALP